MCIRDRVLEKEMERCHVKVHLKTQVKELLLESAQEGTRVTGIKLQDGAEIEGDKVIVATGGCSYQATGSTGDGYLFARQAGLQVSPLLPALVPLETREEYVLSLIHIFF